MVRNLWLGAAATIIYRLLNAECEIGRSASALFMTSSDMFLRIRSAGELSVKGIWHTFGSLSTAVAPKSHLKQARAVQRACTGVGILAIML